mmetsp:Transcript_43444/g.78053  ORF Transcript_43444/g.78053 Transcript_43444/m.78053 type:complete len:201 (+) Transcript_43444:63-665(+)
MTFSTISSTMDQKRAPILAMKVVDKILSCLKSVMTRMIRSVLVSRIIRRSLAAVTLDTPLSLPVARSTQLSQTLTTTITKSRMLGHRHPSDSDLSHSRPPTAIRTTSSMRYIVKNTSSTVSSASPELAPQLPRSVEYPSATAACAPKYSELTIMHMALVTTTNPITMSRGPASTKWTSPALLNLDLGAFLAWSFCRAPWI